MFCRKCGTRIDEGQKFCKSCGTPVAAPQPVQNQQPQQPFVQPQAQPQQQYTQPQAQPQQQYTQPQAQPQPQYTQPQPQQNPAQGSPIDAGKAAVNDAVAKVMGNEKVAGLVKKGWAHYAVVLLLVLISFITVSCGAVWSVGVPEAFEELAEWAGMDDVDEYLDEMREQFKENKDELKEELGYVPKLPFGTTTSIKDAMVFSFAEDWEDGMNIAIDLVIFFVFIFPFILSLVLMLIPLIPSVKLSSKYMWLMRFFSVTGIISFIASTALFNFAYQDTYDCGLGVSFAGVLYIIFVLAAFVMSFVAGAKINEARKAEAPAAVPYGQPYAQQPYNQYQNPAQYQQPQQYQNPPYNNQNNNQR